MPADTRIDEVKTLLDAINAADEVEDAQYEAAIAAQTALVADLQAERAGILTDLQTQRVNLQATLTALDARITALGG